MRRIRGALLPLLAALAACSGGSKPAPEPVAAGDSAASAVSLPGGATPGYAVGQRYEYDLKLSSKVVFQSQGDVFDFDLTGTLEVVPLSAGQAGTEIRATIRGGRFQSRVPGSQPQFDALASDLEKSFLFTLKGGRVSEATLPEPVEPLVAGVFRTTSAALQFARPSAETPRWTATEFDTTGEYSAEYRLTGPNHYEKRKERYLGLLLAKGQPKPSIDVLPELVVSRGDVQTAADGRPIAIKLEDELRLNRAQTPIGSKTSISLRATAAGAAPKPGPELVALRERGFRLTADQPLESRVPPESIERAKINGLTFAEISARLEQAATAELSRGPTPKGSGHVQKVEHKEEESRLFIALGATFRQNPETVTAALTKIRANSPAKFAYIDALGGANSPAANDALIELARSTANDVKLRTSALISLSRLEQPTEKTAAALESLLDDKSVGTQALYGLGSYCRRFRERGELERSEALGRVLVARLGAAKSELRTVEALRAIANAGYARALENVRPLLTDRRDLVRAEAVRALRVMPEPEVDRILISRLVDDSSKTVRLSTIEAMQARTPNDALVRALQNSSSTHDPHVRYRIVELMTRWLSKYPVLRPTLELVAKHEQEEKIRDLARASL